jgi:antirestriction protein ArdC
MEKSVFSSLLSEALSNPGVISEAYSAFHSYSLGNQLHAYVQCMVRQIPLGPIATFPGWKDKGRHVRKGEKAISMCMPVTCKAERKNESGDVEAYAFNRFVFRPNWFVLAQTDGADYAAEVKSPAWDADKALAALEITQAPFEHSDGNCQGYAVERRIAVNPVAEFPHKTRFHELAHIVLGHTAEGAMTDSERTPKDIREVEAESVAYVLCSLLGLPGQDESRGYIQHWLCGQEIRERNAQRIFTAADKILKAGGQS